MSSDDTIMEDVINQGRMIDKSDRDEGVALMGEKEEEQKAEEVKVIVGDAQVEGRQAEIQAEIYQIDMNHPSKVKERSRKGQSRIKTRQKREAWRSQEMLKAVTVDRARKTKENKKRMNENSNTVGKLFKFKETRKDKGLNCNILKD
uniref:Uncharacterized protein n=1 Tax=Tanacetum cinerariifolium TaxID=118510 RepID=A0A699L3Z1_TANCI|nr:hypothetical protein [Tanacetum cinerariifolium]